MTSPVAPVERAFATGHQGSTLALIVCADWLWAGLYASPHSITPIEVVAVPRLVASADARRLIFGHQGFYLTRASLLAARRWLDRQGVNIRDVKRKPLQRKA